MPTRWVEDESWLSNGSWALVQEGRLRMPIFPADPPFAVDVGPPLHHLGMAASFAVFGLGICNKLADGAIDKVPPPMRPYLSGTARGMRRAR